MFSSRIIKRLKIRNFHLLLILLFGIFNLFGELSSGHFKKLKNHEPMERPIYLYLDKAHPGAGLFSIFNGVLGFLNEFETRPCAGIEIDFGKTGLYYSYSNGMNFWNYFCLPIKLGSKLNAHIKTFDMHEFADYSMAGEKLSRQRAFQLIEKYIFVKNEIQEKVQSFASKHFSGNYVIAVHYRGTDKVSEAPRISYEEVISKVNQFIHLHSLKNYKIFVATDEEPFVNAMKEAFKEKAVFYGCKRSTNNHALHYGGNNSAPYQTGEDALIDCLLLSKGDVLFRTSSNLSLWAGFFNPFLPIIELTHRY